MYFIYILMYQIHISTCWAGRTTYKMKENSIDIFQRIGRKVDNKGRYVMEWIVSYRQISSKLSTNSKNLENSLWWKWHSEKSWLRILEHMTLTNSCIFRKKTKAHKLKENPDLFSCLHFWMVKMEVSTHWSVKFYYACPSLKHISVKRALIFCGQIKLSFLYSFKAIVEIKISGHFAPPPSLSREYLYFVTYRK